MSADAPTLPDTDTAYRRVMDDAYAGAVLQTLAARGYPARHEKQASELLGLAARVVAMTPALEKAAGVADPYGEAADALDNLAAQSGLWPTKQAAEADNALRAAADRLAQDPDLYNAVLALKAAEADRYAAAR